MLKKPEIEGYASFVDDLGGSGVFFFNKKIDIKMVEGDSKGTIDTVQVALRIRPLMQLETDRGCEECIDVVAGQPQVQIKDLAFTYNYVFPQHITQQEFYDTAVKGLIGKLFQGKCCFTKLHKYSVNVVLC